MEPPSTDTATLPSVSPRSRHPPSHSTSPDNCCASARRLGIETTLYAARSMSGRHAWSAGGAGSGAGAGARRSDGLSCDRCRRVIQPGSYVFKCLYVEPRALRLETTRCAAALLWWHRLQRGLRIRVMNHGTGFRDPLPSCVYRADCVPPVLLLGITDCAQITSTAVRAGKVCLWLACGCWVAAVAILRKAVRATGTTAGH